jgi:hypothetical protein
MDIVIGENPFFAAKEVNFDDLQVTNSNYENG